MQSELAKEMLASKGLQGAGCTVVRDCYGLGAISAHSAWAAWQGGVPRKSRLGVLRVTGDVSAVLQTSRHEGGGVIPTQAWKASEALEQVVMAFWPYSLIHSFCILKDPTWAMDHQPGS